MTRSTRRMLGPWAAALAIAACVPGDAPGPQGRLAIDVAPLSLSGVSRADYAITVTNGPDGSGEVVWTRALSSATHGDGAGSLSYVGPCDATTGMHTVTLTLTALHDANGPLAPGAFMNPTPLSVQALCQANTDVSARFDLTVMRRAEQGFFDVAIQFDDIFCSAKLDCCRPSSGTLCATDGSDDIALLSTPEGGRGRTFVLGFACTAGTEAATTTTLLLDDLALDCDVGSTSDAFVADVTIAPTGPDGGNQCASLAGAMSSCPAVTEYGSADADAYLFQVAVYRGEEALATPTGAAHMAYWNVALGVGPDISFCTLRTRGTAYDATDPRGPAEGAAYPYVIWDVDLDDCAAEGLSFDSPGAPVTAGYAPFALSTPFPAPALSFSPATLTCDVGQACASPAPTNAGGPVATFAMSPAPPAGLSLDPATGVIAGTPTAPSPDASYTVTASNPGGSSSTVLTLAVRDAAPTGLTYTPTSLTCTRGQACALAAPTHGGGAVVTYTIAPSLPAGLSLDGSTGAIAGTPTVTAVASSYTVTASNTGGSTTRAVTVTVNDQPPTNLTYTPTSLSCVQGQACALAAPSHGGGAVVTYAIAPSLPAGLSLHSSTGAIAGTPTVTAVAASYTVTASNSGGSTTRAVTVTVTAPSLFMFTDAGANGQHGPSQAQVNAAYAGTTLSGAVTSVSGMQRWVVPATGTYRIEALGAAAGNAHDVSVTFGKGARMRGDFALAAGTVLNIVVGQRGENNGGGGGGTFVWVEGAGLPTIVAGGGGGTGGSTGNPPATQFFGSGKDGVTETSGTDGNGSGRGGTDGGAGTPGNTYGANGLNGSGGGGAGWSADATGGFVGEQYNALRHGRGGGGGGPAGGFGGGGSCWIGGGGGGGYSGGGGGTWSSGTGGGGGGSYNAGATQSNTAGANSGDGRVTLTRL